MSYKPHRTSFSRNTTVSTKSGSNLDKQEDVWEFPELLSGPQKDVVVRRTRQMSVIDNLNWEPVPSMTPSTTRPSSTMKQRPTTALKVMKLDNKISPEISRKKERMKQKAKSPQSVDADKDYFSKQIALKHRIVEERIKPRAFTESTESIARSLRLLSRTTGAFSQGISRGSGKSTAMPKIYKPIDLPVKPARPRKIPNFKTKPPDNKLPSFKTKAPVTFPHLSPHVPVQSSYILLSSKSDRWHLDQSVLTQKKLVLFHQRLISIALSKDFPIPRPVSAFETTLPNLTGWVGAPESVPCLSRECQSVTTVPSERYTTAKESRVLRLGNLEETSDMFAYTTMRGTTRGGVKSENVTRAGRGITRAGPMERGGRGATVRTTGGLVTSMFGLGALGAQA